MKNTGIVRKIDNLGRVVIPAEIRKVMFIREGDPLKIYTGELGEVMFKKYSPLGELRHFAGMYAETLHQTSGFAVIVCDRDMVIAAAGAPKKELLERRVSDALKGHMERRGVFADTGDGSKSLMPVDGMEYRVVTVATVIVSGDVYGCVALLSNGDAAHVTETEIKLVSTAAGFLAKTMEE